MKRTPYNWLMELALIAALGALGVASCGGSTSFTSMFEDEVKANVRLIQVALERYATDNDGSYPRYIWGGDKAGWDTYYDDDYVQDEEDIGTMTNIYDPLVRYGYLDSYPANPFVTDGSGILEMTSCFEGLPGQGDPRFGFDGTVMGNTLSDPRFPEADDTLGGAVDGIWGGGIAGDWWSNPGHTYQMGGWFDPEGEIQTTNFLPGQFFYRSGGDMLLDYGHIPRTGDVAQDGFAISGYAKGDARLIVKLPRTDRFMLGGYGSTGTTGMDILRIGDWDRHKGGYGFFDPNGELYWGGILYYQSIYEPGEESDNPIMFPEVMGGGTSDSWPTWPYRDSDTNEWIYGSPDGSPDGVIFVVTDRGDWTGPGA